MRMWNELRETPVSPPQLKQVEPPCVLSSQPPAVWMPYEEGCHLRGQAG